MNIALSHFRIGETDGVSLEMEKWKLILEKLGHKVYYLAGSPGNTDAYIIPELHYKEVENLKFIENAFVKLEDYKDENEFKAAIEAYTERAEKHLEEFLQTFMKQLVELKEENYNMSAEELNRVIEDVK